MPKQSQRQKLNRKDLIFKMNTPEHSISQGVPLMSTAAAKVKERPILFSSAMVRAILEGRKNQHRTVVRLMPSWTAQGLTHGDLVESGWWVSPEGWQYGDEIVPCPYGKPGDRLWVRETWYPAYKRTDNLSGCIYKADYGYRRDLVADYTPGDGWNKASRMPRWASRLTLEIVKVKVERLQESHLGTPKESYESLWDSINAKRDGGKHAWSANPWVWAIEFKRVHP